MADWSKPTLSSLYTDFLTEVKNRDDDLAKQFDGTTTTNLVTGYIRWNSSINRWQKWNGTAWAELATTYALTGLSTTGNASIGGTLAVTGTTTFTGAATFNGGIAGNPNFSGAPTIGSVAIVTISGTQTLTNKTLSGGTLSGTLAGDHTVSGQTTFSNATAPIISAKIGTSAAIQHTIPAVTSDTIALLAAAQTFTNKTLTSPTINTATIAGGTINNAPIGGTTPSTGAFSTLSASGQVTFSGTGAATMNSGTTAQRPTGVTGMFRFNSSLGKFEGYNGSAWGAVGGGATGGGSDDVFLENGQTVTTNYTITANKNAVSAGVVTIASGVTVTVPSGSFWVVV